MIHSIEFVCSFSSNFKISGNEYNQAISRNRKKNTEIKTKKKKKQTSMIVIIVKIASFKTIKNMIILLLLLHLFHLKYVSAGKFLIPYCLANRLSFILTKSTPNESVSSSIFSSSAKTLSQVIQLLASKFVPN